MSKQSLGAKGEELAAQYLEQRGYSLLYSNWRCREGEIDIIAQHDETYVFCEVKTRHTRNVEDAFANISVTKREKLIKAVYHYLQEHNLENVLWRIDAIGIALPPKGQPIIEHVEDAFDW